MSAVFYINLQTGKIQTTEPEGVTLIEAGIPEESDAAIVLPLLAQILQQANLRQLPQSYEPPALAYRISLGAVA